MPLTKEKPHSAEPAAVSGTDLIDAVNLLPEKYRPRLIESLAIAEDNQEELVEAIKAVPPAHRAAIAFLIANMPEADLKTIKKTFLLENIDYAYKAREAVTWGKDLPEELFFNDVLPYANLNERRDNWRKDFYEKFLPVAKKCKTTGEAVLELNKAVFVQLNVRYHPIKTHKPDQSPYESTTLGYATCTGLSIMLVDVCRAVGIPARVAGVPEWVSTEGNHTWTEVWDRQWYFVGSAEPGPLNHTWFVGNAAQALASETQKSIYASSYARTKTYFPLIWAKDNREVPAYNVTGFYTRRRKVSIAVLDKLNGEAKAADLTLRLHGQIVAHDTGKSAYAFELAGGETYQAELQTKDGVHALHDFTLSDADSTTVQLTLR